MEAILIFDTNNYPVILRYNNKFLDLIAQVAAKYGLSAGGSSKEATRSVLKDNSEEFKNVLIMLFAPYVASVRIQRNKLPPTSMLNECNRHSKISYTEVRLRA